MMKKKNTKIQMIIIKEKKRDYSTHENINIKYMMMTII